MPAKPDAEPIMSRDEMKPLLLLSKREPVSCAVGLTRDKQGTLLLHRKTKPRKLMAELKRQATAAGLDLDAASLRFGRANVDAGDAGTVRFAINKAAPAALRMKLVEQLRPAGFQKCELVVDGTLESEPDEDVPEGSSEGQTVPGQTLPGQADAAAAGPGLSPSGPNAPGDADAPAQATSGPSGGAPADASDGPSEEAPDAASRAAQDAVPDAASDGNGTAGGAGAMRDRLTGLVRRVADAAAASPADAGPLKAAAIQAREALRSGDLAGAGRGADALGAAAGRRGGERRSR